MATEKQKKLINLYLCVRNNMKNKINLKTAIKLVSQQVGLKEDSVKNYYYKAVKLLSNNAELRHKFGIKDELFLKNKFEKFNDIEKKKLLFNVNTNLERGISIRKTCLELANGDAKKMLRYQNKYRSLTRQDNSKKESKVKIINISNAKQKLNRHITDSEINALFMGLINIVKKSAIENANTELKTECEVASQNFRQSIIDLNQKEMELKRMYEINNKLNLKIQNQQAQICLLLDKFSKRKLGKLERKSDSNYLKLKKFVQKSKTNNIL